MENKKTLSTDQLNALKETVRQRFDELYHRIGSNRQNLMNKVLFVHHQINKELAKDIIDGDQEKEILLKVRETERSADKQLPLIRKVVPQAVSSPTPPAPAKAVTPVKESKPKESKPKEKPKESKVKESKPKAKESKAKTVKAKPAKKKKK